VRVLPFVDRTRMIRLPDGKSVPRPIETVVRYPAGGGPYPLIVFAHGFALTPAPYDRLLRYWTRAGYVVAAPVFPLENANAPGGPTQSDLVNEPRDISVVITKLLALGARTSGVLAGKIDSTRIAVAGHSDGAVAALAAAYDRRHRDRRIDAAIVLSGATLPGMGPFPVHGPPLLAAQGTADRTNSPSNTEAYFDHARRPKFLLWLVGASHLPPYTGQEPQLGIVERATTAFLGHYLQQRSLRLFEDSARRAAITRLIAEP
jgi:pimeloyl-ACP methyl ester carboxylesterase